MKTQRKIILTCFSQLYNADICICKYEHASTQTTDASLSLKRYPLEALKAKNPARLVKVSIYAWVTQGCCGLLHLAISDDTPAVAGFTPSRYVYYVHQVFSIYRNLFGSQLQKPAI